MSNVILEASQAGSRERAKFQQKFMRTLKLLLECVIIRFVRRIKIFEI